MEMSLQENPQTSRWFNKPTMDYPTHSQNDTVSRDDCGYRHVAPGDREPMFEKPLTPSDVGKLNRLVIPKQHAERHFPLGGGGDAAGTLLAFEDEAGKCWRFRYSYWNSSQSYVLTKGWSRYVKEKRLDAGDVVCFERHRGEPDRTFIGWRRRGAPPMGGGLMRYNAQGYYQAQDSRRQGGVLPHAPAAAAREVTEAATQQQGESSNSRRLVRLFGVNLECQHDNPSTSSSQTTSSEISVLSAQQQGYGYYFDYSSSSTHQPPSYDHLEMNFPQGVNQMGNGLI